MSSYFVKLGNSKTGPFQFPVLKSMADAGTILPLDLVSLDGSDWRQARFIPELFSQEALLQLNSQERTLPAKAPLDQEGDLLRLKKTIWIAAGTALVFGLTLGWGIMAPSQSRFSKLETQVETLQAENDKLRRDFSGSITREEHSRLSTQQSELFSQQEKDLKDSLATARESLSKANASHLQAMNRLREEAKVFVEKANELEKTIDPVKDLVARLKDDPQLQELMQKIQKVPGDELETTYKELQKTLAQRQAARAVELRQEYRTFKGAGPGDFSDTLARWNRTTRALLSLSRDHKFSAAATTTLEDLKNSKDLDGLFILRTLANETRVKHLQDLQDNSPEEAEKKAAGKLALGEAVQNTVLILKGMDLDPAMFIAAPVIAKPGMEPRILLEEIRKKLFEVHRVFDNEEPKRVENHLEGLEKVSALATKVIHKYADTGHFKELQNDLNKYKAYPLLNAELTGVMKKQEMLAKLQKSTKSLGRLPKDQLIKRLDQLYHEMEIARIAGVFSDLKAVKPDEN